MPLIFFRHGIASASIPADMFTRNGSTSTVHTGNEHSGPSDKDSTPPAVTRAARPRRLIRLLPAILRSTALPLPVLRYRIIASYTTPTLVDLVTSIRAKIQHINKQQEILDLRIAQILAEHQDGWQDQLQDIEIDFAGGLMTMEAAMIAQDERVEELEDEVSGVVHVLYRRVLEPGFGCTVRKEGSTANLGNAGRGIHTQQPLLVNRHSSTDTASSVLQTLSVEARASSTSDSAPPTAGIPWQSRIRTLLNNLTSQRIKPPHLSSYSTPALLTLMSNLWDQIHSFNVQTTFITTSLVCMLASANPDSWEAEERDFKVLGSRGEVHWRRAQEVLYQAIEDNMAELEMIREVLWRRAVSMEEQARSTESRWTWGGVGKDVTARGVP